MFEGDPGPVTVWITFTLRDFLIWLRIIKPDRKATSEEEKAFREMMEAKGFHFDK